MSQVGRCRQIGLSLHCICIRIHTLTGQAGTLRCCCGRFSTAPPTLSTLAGYREAVPSPSPGQAQRRPGKRRVFTHGTAKRFHQKRRARRRFQRPTAYFNCPTTSRFEPDRTQSVCAWRCTIAALHPPQRACIAVQCMKCMKCMKCCATLQRWEPCHWPRTLLIPPTAPALRLFGRRMMIDDIQGLWQ
jgi:hypothetical protein